MKTQIKFPLTLDNYLSPTLGKQERIFNQEQMGFNDENGSNDLPDLQNPVSSTELKSKKKLNPRLKFL
jgi:hypothetical protein